MPSIKDILIEMKNMSELMVDLSYSAVLFNSKDAAHEVLKLENRINSLNYEIKIQSLLAARSKEDAERLTALLEIAEAAESIANAAKDLADLILKGFKPHPVFKRVMEESDEMIISVEVYPASELCNKTLGELLLNNRTGMRVIAIRRHDSWIYGPYKHTVILEDDVLLAKGSETGSDILVQIAHGEMSFDDVSDALDEEESDDD